MHYNWHWFWHWGTGELGNNGVHGLDVCRWGLGVDFPTRVTSGGGKYRWDDDQETPDTHIVTFDFDGKLDRLGGAELEPARVRGRTSSAWLLRRRGNAGRSARTATRSSTCRTRSRQGGGRAGDEFHLANFLDCIRSGKRPNADIEEGHKSTLLCHLGNIAYRTGRVLSIDPQNGHIKNDAEAEALWRREYRTGWEPQV